MRRTRLLCVSLLIVTPVFAQAPRQDRAPNATEFEVASIRQTLFPNDAFSSGFVSGAGTCAAPRVNMTGNRVAFPSVTLCGLIRFAYDVRDYEITGMPPWMMKPEQSIFYDIDTRVETGTMPTQVELRQMLQALLADRFQLKVHREMRESPVYALVVSKSRLKLNEGNPCPNQSTGMRVGPGLLASCGPTTSMGELAQLLSRETDRIVVDRTGLTGQYAFKLQWSRDGAAVQADSSPSFFTAIQEQLGLKLEPQKMPVDALIVDRAEKPSPN